MITYSERLLKSLAFALIAVAPTIAQVTFEGIDGPAGGDAGDRILNAPYRGTVNSLREATMDVGYGENRTFVHPIVSSGTMSLIVPTDTVKVWHNQSSPNTPWDRSALRLYVGVDASGREIDLTNATDEASGVSLAGDLGTDNVLRLSLRAVGTKSLAPVQFQVTLKYRLQSSPPGSYQMPTETIKIAPMTSIGAGESEAFLFGVPLLDVRCGNAHLTVPTGRTAISIGAAMATRKVNSSVQVPRYDVIFPGAAETTYIQDRNQFALSTIGLFRKANYGTPWPGYLLGRFAERVQSGPDFRVAVRLPDGGVIESNLNDTDPDFGDVWRLSSIRPLGLSGSAAAQTYTWEDNFPADVVTQIRDNQTPTANSITLNRDPAGFVTSIQTSDGRSWTILNETLKRRITGIVPGDGSGARYFKYLNSGDSINKFRINQVRLGAANGGDDTNPDTGDQIMYKFLYRTTGDVDDIKEEYRFVDGLLRKVVDHVLVSDALRQRKELAGPNASDIRRFDFAYDTTASPPLKHRLKSMTAYSGADGAGTAYLTQYTHHVGVPSDLPINAGTMVIQTVTQPDGTTLNYQYNKHVGVQPANFGLRTKTTHTGPSGSLVTYDIDYEFFYNSGGERLFHSPRIAKERDGRGAISEVVSDYEDGGADQASPDGTPADGLTGELSNQLRTRTGPTITQGTSGTRTPLVRYSYYNTSTSRMLKKIETRFGSGAADFRRAEYEYDTLLRLRRVLVDPTGVNSITEYVYNDTLSTQDRTVIDPELYHTKTRFDYSGRPRFIQRFLTAGSGSGNFYQTENVYDSFGRLFQIKVDNKDQNGVVIPGQTHPIVTEHAYDRLGRLTLGTHDPGGIGQTMTYDYNWLGAVEEEFDTSGRGVRRVFEGRGLVDSETPLVAPGHTPDTGLTVFFDYDANGRLEFTTKPTGVVQQTDYDDFGHAAAQIQIPIAGSGDTNNAVVFEYDAASRVTRQTARENFTIGMPGSGTALSDSKHEFDEGGFNFRSRERFAVGVDNDATDPVTERKFDWAGNVTESRSKGDATVADRVITNTYDGAQRLFTVADSEAGLTTYSRDDRGKVLDLTVRIDGSNAAVTTTVYDALSRATRVTDPEDDLDFNPSTPGQRHYRDLRYDSRGNPLRETRFTSTGFAEITTVNLYDNASRRTRTGTLSNAAGFTDPITAPAPATDRVENFMFDADGRPQTHTTYNNNSGVASLVTTATYDSVGRVDVTSTFPATTQTDDNYLANGRLNTRVVNDGVGSRTFTFAYDGHDRVSSQTASGTPNLITSFDYDGLSRQTLVTDPKNISTVTDYDLVGRREALIENSGGMALERRTDFTFNRLSQLITQTAQNKTALGALLAPQITRYRYDTLGRAIRSVYPDNVIDDTEPEIAACSDCLRMDYDDAGRMTSRTEQRVLATVFTYDDRGLLLTRTTTALDRKDKFTHDAVGRIIATERGTQANSDLFASSVAQYTDLGDLDFEDQAIAEQPLRRVDYAHDQAGNRTGLTYPGGATISYVPTPLNQVDSMTFGTQSVDYLYNGGGPLVDKRRTTTTGTNTIYETDWGYDSHRRTNQVRNAVEPNGPQQLIAQYDLTHNENGAPTSSLASGQAVFASDDRNYTVDALDRLRATSNPAEWSCTDNVTLDLVGNRESATPWTTCVSSTYTLANAGNEYATVGGTAVTYDAAGNLTVDEEGRQYFYDERNRLIEVRSSGSATLALYTYDALGRRVTTTIGGVTTRIYYDGARELEERNSADVRLRYHVNGAQYIDERVGTFSDSSSQFRYYVLGDDFAVVGSGDAAGGDVKRVPYGPNGEFDCFICNNCSHPVTCDGDVDGDETVGLADLTLLLAAFGSMVGQPEYNGCADFDCNGTVSLQDQALLLSNFGQPCSSDCPRQSGVLALHGRPVDVLPDNKTLLYVRARTYDPKNGRWLQRDPSGYSDGNNLYESFRGNAAWHTDPTGQQIDVGAIIERLFLGQEHGPELDPGADEVADYWHRAMAALGGLFSGRGEVIVTSPLPTQAQVNRTALRFFRDDADRYSDEFVVVLLQRDLDYTGYSMIVFAVPEAFGADARAELYGLGPTKGAALSIEGTTQILADLADVSIRGTILLGSDITGYGLEPEDIPRIIGRPEFVPNDLFFHTPAGQNEVSRVVGGNAILILAPQSFAVRSGSSIPIRIASESAPVGASGDSIVLLTKLREAGGTLVAPRGTITAQDIAALHRASGNEIALFRELSTGTRYLRELGPIGGELPAEGIRLILHTQPGAGPLAVVPSGLDRIALAQLRQRSSVIISSEGDAAIRFGRSTASDNPIIILKR